MKLVIKISKKKLNIRYSYTIDGVKYLYSEIKSDSSQVNGNIPITSNRMKNVLSLSHVRTVLLQ